MSLSELSYQLRRLLPIGAIGMLFIAILFISIRILLLVIAQNQPPTPVVYVKPAYGILKRPDFIAQSQSTDLKYSLDTFSGVPEDATREARVYFKPRKTPSFGSSEKARLAARIFGFSDEVKSKVDGYTVTFVDAVRRLTMDISTFNYSFTHDFDTDLQKALGQVHASDAQQQSEDQLIQKATTYMTDLGRYPDTLSRGTRKLIYHQYDEQNKQVKIATSSAVANMIEVDFFPEKIDNMDVFTQSYYTSPHFIMFIPGGSTPIVKAQVSYFETSLSESSVYPLKTSAQAYDELLKGHATIVSGSREKGSTISITRIAVGYVEPDAYSEYLQPYFIFSDSHDFVAYIPAIADEWLEPRATLTGTTQK
ncbi:MAG: hypothetical protein WCO78_01975 [Candidatus Roizmanbacteria bacterium]